MVAAIRTDGSQRQADCKAGAPLAAAMNLCPLEPRGTRAQDPQTDSALRGYLRETLVNAFLDGLRHGAAARAREAGIDGDDDEAPEVATVQLHKWVSSEGEQAGPQSESIECLERGMVFLETEIVPGLSERDRRRLAQCEERRASEVLLAGTGCACNLRRGVTSEMYGSDAHS